MRISKRQCPTQLGVIMLALGLLGTATAALAGSNGNPGVLPVGSSPHGKTYGEWSAEHWKWTFSFPVDHHPQTDTADCSAGQSGPVWFLGGTFTTTTTNSPPRKET